MEQLPRTIKAAVAFLFSCTILLGGCSRNDGTETIDIYKFEVRQLTEARMDSLSVEKEVIELTSDDVSIPARPQKVKIAGDRIYVLDNPAIREYRMLVFDRSGRFIRQIGAMGRGPGEYLGISDFAIAPDSSLWIEDAVANNLIHYSKDLRYIGTVPTSYDADCMEFLEDGNLIVNISHWNPDRIRIAVTDTLFGEENRRTVINYNYEPNPYVHYGSGQLNIIREGWLHSYPPLGDIYLFDSKDGKLKQHFFLDFGPDKITAEDILELGDGSDDMKFIQSIEDHVFLLRAAYVSDDYIIGRINDKKDDKDFIADRNSHVIYKSQPGSPNRIIGQSGDWTMSLATPDTEEAHYKLILRRFQ